jgi:hypothetical protein
MGEVDGTAMAYVQFGVDGCHSQHGQAFEVPGRTLPIAGNTGYYLHRVPPQSTSETARGGQASPSVGVRSEQRFFLRVTARSVECGAVRPR